jgi:hypothetical protein
MRFEIVMHMPVRGNEKREDSRGVPQPVPLIHRLIVEHPAETLEDFLDILQNFDFVIVEEFFPDPYTKAYTSHGYIALNHRYIGKIKQWER